MINNFKVKILGCTVEGRGQEVAEIMRRLGVPRADEMMMRGVQADRTDQRTTWRRIRTTDFGKKASL